MSKTDVLMNISPDRIKRGLYWEKPWTLNNGCTRISPGCDNCWSEEQDKRRINHPNENIRLRARDVVMTCGVNGSLSDGTATGWQEVTGYDGRIILREDNLDLPLKTRKPTVFAIWNDLYHENVTDEFRDRAYAVMALCPQHTFLVLTKRAQRMAEYFTSEGNAFPFQWGASISYLPFRFEDPDSVQDSIIYGDFPLKNVWHGVTAENQEQADQRIPDLLQVPGKRFVSIEPMLSDIDLSVHFGHRPIYGCGKHSNHWQWERIHAVLLGGESGKNARQSSLEWHLSVVEQCADAGVPAFVKQLHVNGKLSKNPEKWPEDLRVRELPWLKEVAC